MSASIAARPDAPSSLLPRVLSRLRPPRSAVPRGASTIAMARPAALTLAGLASGAAVAALQHVLGRDAALVSPWPILLPLAVAASAVGVGRLVSAGPQAFSEWRGPLGYATVGPWLLALLAVAVTGVPLPWWVAALGLPVGVPFLWSAVGPRRLRLWLVPAPDAYGRRGGLLAAAALSLSAYSVLRPDVGGLVEGGLLVALLVAAFLARGLADAAATWGPVQWAALVWGALVRWAAPAAGALGTWSSTTAAHVGLALVAGAPLAASVLRPDRPS